MARWVCLVLGVCGFIGAGCQRREESATVVSPPPSPAEPLPPEPPPDPTRRLFFATFVDDRLDECIELAIVFESVDGEIDARMRRAAEAFIAEANGDEREVLEIPRPCDEQFASKVALSACVLPAKRGEGVTMILAQRNYDFATALQDDGRMADCLRDGGEWTAVAEDSHEYREAELRAQSAELRRGLRQINRR